MQEPSNRSGVCVRRRSFSTQLDDALPQRQRRAPLSSSRHGNAHPRQSRTTTHDALPIPSVGRSVDSPAQLSTADGDPSRSPPQVFRRVKSTGARSSRAGCRPTRRPTVERVSAPGHAAAADAGRLRVRVTYAVASDARRVSRSTGEENARGTGFAATVRLRMQAGSRSPVPATDANRAATPCSRRRAAPVDDTNDVLIPHATRSATHRLLLLLPLPLLLSPYPSRRCSSARAPSTRRDKSVPACMFTRLTRTRRSADAVSVVYSAKKELPRAADGSAP
jgi:hypothetical protein